MTGREYMCRECGAPLPDWGVRGHSLMRRYCNRTCGDRYRARRRKLMRLWGPNAAVLGTCAACGKPLWDDASADGRMRADRRTCSAACRQRLHRRAVRAAAAEPRQPECRALEGGSISGYLYRLSDGSDDWPGQDGGE